MRSTAVVSRIVIICLVAASGEMANEATEFVRASSFPPASIPVLA
jgi:hypothetical protein